jgi:hypothetical protein
MADPTYMSRPSSGYSLHKIMGKEKAESLWLSWRP